MQGFITLREIIKKFNPKFNKLFFTRISQISLLLILLKRNYLRIFVSFAANPLQRIALLIELPKLFDGKSLFK